MNRVMKLFVVGLVCILLTGCSLWSRLTGEQDQAERVDAFLTEQTTVQEDRVPRSEAVEAGNRAADLLQQRVSWKILEAKDDVCTIEFTAPDMDWITRKAYSTMIESSDAAQSDHSALVVQLTEDMIRILKSGDYPTVTETVELEIEDGQPVMDREAYDAMYGGVLSVVQAIEEAGRGAK